MSGQQASGAAPSTWEDGLALVTVTILVGLPGCGKTTLAQSLSGPGVVVVSSDDARMDVHGSLRAGHDLTDPDRQAALHRPVFDLYHARIAEHLAAGRSVIADATHLDFKARRAVADVAEKAGAIVRVVVLTDVAGALARNEERRGTDKHVPAPEQRRLVGELRRAVLAIPLEGYADVVWLDPHPA